jgi:hypothetical protein
MECYTGTDLAPSMDEEKDDNDCEEEKEVEKEEEEGKEMSFMSFHVAFFIFVMCHQSLEST